MDFESLTGDLSARRVDFAVPRGQPAASRKPTGAGAARGGQAVQPKGRAAHKLLVDWVAGRAPGPDPAEADAASLEILPGDRTIKQGETQQLLVRAHYPDGRVRDVTWLTQFFSNDEATAVSVTPDGLVKSLRPGRPRCERTSRGRWRSSRSRRLTRMKSTRRSSSGRTTRSTSTFSRSWNRCTCRRRRRATTRRSSGGRSWTRSARCQRRPRRAAFLADARADKRAKLVDDLLARPEFADYWALQLGDLLQNRKERDHDVRGAKGVRALHGVAARAGGRRPAMGPDRPGRADRLRATRPSTRRSGTTSSTLGEKQNVEESDIADSVAQAFLGTRVGCARCHNHPLEKYTQDDYYHFAAFFSRAVAQADGAGEGDDGPAR